MASLKFSNSFKRFLQITLCAFILGSIFIFSLPTILSNFGHQRFIQLFNTQIPGKIKIEQMDIGWMQSIQSFKKVELEDEQGTVIARIDDLKINSPLWYFVVNDGKAGTITFNGLNADVKVYPTGSNNILKALKKNVKIQGTPKAISLYQTEGSIHFPSEENPSCKLVAKGETEQEGLKGNFTIDLGLNGLNPNQITQLNQEQLIEAVQSGKLSINADINNFPLSLIDSIISFKYPKLQGLILKSFGNYIHASIHQSVTADKAYLEIVANTAQANVKLPFELVPGYLNLIAPSQIQISLSPSISSLIAKFNDSFGNFGLDNPIDVSLGLEKLSIPLKNFTDGFDLTTIEGKINASISPIKFLSPPLALENLQSSITIGKDGVIGLFNGDYAFSQLHSPFKFTFNSLDFKKWNIQLKSAFFSIPNIQISNFFSKTFSLKTDQPIHFFLPPELVATFANSSSVMQNAIEGDLNVQELTLFDQAGKITPVLSANMHINPLTLKEIPTLENISFKGLDLIVDMKSLEDIKTTFQVNNLNSSNWTNDWIAKLENLIIHGNVSVTNSDSLVWDGNINSKLIRTNMQLSFKDYGKTITLLSPTKLFLNIPENVLTHQVQNEPTEVTIALNPTVINLNNKNVKTFSGEIAFDKVALKQNNATAILNNFVMPWTLDTETQKISVEFLGKTYFPDLDKHGQIQGKVFLENWLKDHQLNFTNTFIAIDADVSQFPTSFINTFSDKKVWDVLLGDLVNIKCSTKIDREIKQGNFFTFEIHSDDLNANCFFATENGIILKQPATIQFLLTEKRFKALRQLYSSFNTLSLTKDSNVQIQFDKLFIPTSKEIKEIILDGKIKLNQLNITDSLAKETLAFEDLSGTISTHQLGNEIFLHLTGKQLLSNLKKDVVYSIHANQYLKNDNSFNVDSMSLDIDLKTPYLPISLMSQLLSLPVEKKEQLLALFGKGIEANIHTKLEKMEGPVLLEVKGLNGGLNLDGHIAKGILRLNKDFKAQFNLTPHLGKLVVQEIFPLLNGIVRSENPLTITIPHHDFSLPLLPFTIHNLRILSGMVDLGHVTFSKQGYLSTVFSLLNSGSPDITVWFTPLYFHFENGNLTLERLDMLVNEHYPIATWGKIDFLKDKIKMTIGLSGTAIMNAFNITGLKPNDMLQLPYRGTLKTAAIDKSKASSRIGSMVAKNKGLQGHILGTLIDIATGGFNEKKPPEAMMNPLPWEL
ncbi:hypothetical protein BN1013_02187 [Candidatus Rubidus massiliensis]|nr:MAG: hypothetical protein BGO10_11035 [Chlamydia sp. 32-24]CDZ81651.1 hypothetical protein BN1013_02187 [Candidatus Rubidus massiliensis]